MSSRYRTLPSGLYDDWNDDLGVPWAYPLAPLAWQFEETMRTDLEPAARLRHHLGAIAVAVAERPDVFIVLDELDLRARRDESVAATTAHDKRGWRAALAAIFEEGIQQRVWSVDLEVEASVELVIATVKGIRLRPRTAESVVKQLCGLFSPGA